MNKKDLIIAFLLGIVCTQMVSAHSSVHKLCAAPAPFPVTEYQPITRKDLLDAARIIGYGEAASKDIMEPVMVFEHLIEKIK